MVIEWNLTNLFIGVILYAIFCAVACFITLAFDGHFEEEGKFKKKGDSMGTMFIYGPGVALLLLVPLVLLILLSKSVALTGLLFWIWLLIVAILAILVFVAAAPLVAALVPFGAILGIFIGGLDSLFVMEYVFGAWSLVSLLVGIRARIVGWSENIKNGIVPSPQK